MTATNHALTGAIIGLTIDKPLLAIPLAFLSHFVCDAIPHFKFAGDFDNVAKSSKFARYLIIEAFLCFLIVLGLYLKQPFHWQVAAICAFLATSPDFMWIRKFISAKHNKKFHETLFDKFASKIQWFQRPIGAVVEIVWFGAALTVYFILIGLVKF